MNTRRIVLLCTLFDLAFLMPVFAGSATWKSSPTSGDWNTATNWTPQAVPNGPSDIATFATSNQTAVSLSAQTEVNGITFNSGASPFTITAPGNNTGLGLNISGVGVLNDSATVQKFVATLDSTHIIAGVIRFFGSATAGSSTSYSITNGAHLQFNDTSSAGSGTFALSSTGSGTQILFADSSTAGNAVFTIGDTSSVGFSKGTSADSATLIANAATNTSFGGAIVFHARSSGGTSRVELFGNGTGDYNDGNLDLRQRSATANVTIGSLEGTGSVLLGSRLLTVGSNNLSTTFSGIITDCLSSGCGSTTPFGKLSKIGKGKLTLSRSTGNTYSGGTTIKKGTLIATNSTGSATGSGAVQVNSGTLSGTGSINGAVTVGNGTTAGAILQPGVGTTAGTLTINNTVNFNATAAFKCYVNRSTTSIAGKLEALAVMIGTNVSFRLVETGTTTLTSGTVFTIIDNTSANPISGTFSNLPDGGTITSGGTTFKANYEGGDGNDLTLTVQ